MPRRTASPRASPACTGPASAPSRFRVKNAAAAYKRALSLGRLGRRGQGRADGAQHPGHQGHRRFADLPGRPLRRARHHLRRRLRVPARRRAQSQGRRPHLHRPSDAQRPSRAHGGVGRFLRAALQFPRDPLLRHRGQAHRAQEQGDDQPVRQDPHPDQREHRRQVADPGISLGLSRRGHPAHRARHRRHLRDGRDAQDQGRAVPDRARHLLRAGRHAPAGPRRGPEAPGRRPHPDRRRADPGRRAAAADLHPDGDRARSSSRSSSAAATKASARAISAPCSN